jgi:hypothetical protein
VTHVLIEAANSEAYTQACIRHVRRRGEIPVASDRDADAVAFYVDRGWGPAMEWALARHVHEGTPIDMRVLGGEWE